MPVKMFRNPEAPSANALRPAKRGDENRITEAIDLLRKARNLLAEVDAPKSVDKVRAAIRSAEGARRHVERRVRRSNHEVT